MSMPDETTITCPKCGNEQSFTIWNSVNISLDPDLKQKIISRELVTFSCEKCGNKSPVVYPMLYHDMDANLMIWLLPGDEPPEDGFAKQPAGLINISENYQYRWVKSYNELVEKIYIYDAGLDDRAVECFKGLLYNKWEDDLAESDEILFIERTDDEGEEGVHMAIISEEGSRECVVPSTTFDHICNNSGDDFDDIFSLNGPWPRVNYKDRMREIRE
jgi:predicted RNA-binding Zn-ribbon protein involved in translation (DUF1610 family)